MTNASPAAKSPTMTVNGGRKVRLTAPSSTRCPQHAAFNADNCPICGTAHAMGR